MLVLVSVLQAYASLTLREAQASPGGLDRVISLGERHSSAPQLRDYGVMLAHSALGTLRLNLSLDTPTHMTPLPQKGHK